MVFMLHHSGQDVWIFVTSAFVSIFSMQCYGEISVYNAITDQQIAGGYRCYASKFGRPLYAESFEGVVVFLPNAADGCNQSTLSPPPRSVSFNHQWILLMARGNCSFVQKVRNAQNLSYDMAMVYNNASAVVPMNGNNASDIIIPSVFVSLETGLLIQNKYLYYYHVYLVVEDDSNNPFDINADLLIPFAVVVAVCFITMISFMICKCIRDRRRARRHRLPASSLRKIPIEKFSSKLSPFETCAICLDDYVDGEKLRILPCSHAYHTKCIDPWLTRNRRVCPICKRKVFAADELPIEGSESDSDTDNDERTPLVRSETSQPRQPRRTYLLSPESIESILTPISRFDWRHHHEPIHSASHSPDSRSGSIGPCGNVVPASAIRSINSIDEDSLSSGSGSNYNYTGRGVRQLPHCSDYRDVPTQSSVSSGSEIDCSESVAGNYRVV